MSASEKLLGDVMQRLLQQIANAMPDGSRYAIVLMTPDNGVAAVKDGLGADDVRGIFAAIDDGLADSVREFDVERKH